MCCTQARSPVPAGGTPQAARPHGSLAHVLAPQFFREKGGIGDDNIEALEPAVDVPELGITKGVTPQHLGVLYIVEVQVHPGYGCGGQVDLLAIEAHLSQGASSFEDLVGRLDQHAS